MWIANNWNDYKVIDCSQGEKLESWGGYLLVRPDPQVIWNTPKTHKGWKRPNAHYHRSERGGGQWQFFDLPEQWSIDYNTIIGKKLTFQLKPFSFKLRQKREMVASAVPHSSASWVMDMNCTWGCWAST